MSSPTDKLDIVVGEFPTDAMLCNLNGVRTLFLGVDQTFGRAVSNVRNVLPGITVEAAERMVREQAPELRDFDELLGRTDPVPPSVEGPAAALVDDAVREQLPRGAAKRRRRAVLVAALLPALAASWAVGRYTNIDDATSTTAASAPDASPSLADADVVKAPFADPQFKWFSGSSEIVCDPINALEAECTDSDGIVMATKAATGPDSTIFTFSYGSERIGLRIFYDAKYAATWAKQDGSRELYPNMRTHDRYILWGTDPDRIREYNDLLEDADKTSGPTAMGGATPLPPRLAALTLGTLGLDDHEVTQIIAAPQAAPTDTPTLLAARLVLGLDSTPTWPEPGDDDIVALAAGIEPNPPTTSPSGGGTSMVVPVVEPDVSVTPTASAGGSETDTTPSGGGTGTSPTSPPVTDPTPNDPEPSTPTTPTPPPVTDPTPSGPKTTPPVTDPTPSVPKPTPPATEQPPPAEETPPPVEETPPPVETPAPPVEETPPTGQDGTIPAGPEESGDDLLILDSAWTVSAA
ncbi:hypothetical protein SAMN05216483_6721 [Streptomyces sp. 2131.1]|uniref:hypothetical protein n=1 Tax=Streptomyces sp. 2131.1 TaxID=1855346 RepID=UPI0008970CD5|nr:hypothetical protein [Streptomyces sp. 2131.1]SEE83712.1 hypothetical protein SAMN05216483_6721 [Streptomyces sp. 2131.1]